MRITENRRIFLNIIFTYGRSFLDIAASLFVSRWVLMALGQTDLGLFSVVGGLVIFIQFFNNILAGATARFYAISIGEAKANRDSSSLENCRRWFNTALTIHTVLPLCLVLIGYPIAKWAIYNWLTIPAEKMYACLWVLRFTCLASFVSMVNVPFTAMYTAKQYIAELTVYSMISTILRIVLAYYMFSHPGEWLVKYALFICMINILPQIIICIRANYIFAECKIKFSYMCNAQYLKKIGSYVCWTFFGNLAGLLRNQGISLLINKAFGPKVNSAMHIAHRVESGTSTLSSALYKAFAPAIITAVGAKNYTKMKKLAFTACKFSSLLALICTIPLALELPEVICLWLKNPPHYTVGLCYFMLAYYLCDVSTVGNRIAINASGKIKGYQIICSSTVILSLSLAILAVYLGGSVYSIGAVLVLSMALNSLVRIFFAQKLLQMRAYRWFKEIFLPISGLLMAECSLAYIPHFFMPQGIARLFVTVILSEIIFFPLAWVIVLNVSEREFIKDKLNMLRKKILQ